MQKLLICFQKIHISKNIEEKLNRAKKLIIPSEVVCVTYLLVRETGLRHTTYFFNNLAFVVHCATLKGVVKLSKRILIIIIRTI